MIEPRATKDEPERLSELHALRILDTPAEERFDRLARLAKRMFQVSFAAISFIDQDRQWIKSEFGFNKKAIPRTQSICGHTLNEPQPLIVPDTRKDERFLKNALILKDLNIRFYAGVAVKGPRGYRIGTVSIADSVPRIFHADDLAMLEDIARLVEQELSEQPSTTFDSDSELSNRPGFYMIAEHSLSVCIRNKTPAVFALINVEPQTDAAETDWPSAVLKRFFRDSDLVGRFGLHRYAVLMLNTDSSAASQTLTQMTKALNKAARDEGVNNMRYAIGSSEFRPSTPSTIHALVEQAEETLVSL